MITLPNTEDESLAVDAIPFADVWRKSYLILRNYSLKTCLLTWLAIKLSWESLIISLTSLAYALRMVQLSLLSSLFIFCKEVVVACGDLSEDLGAFLRSTQPKSPSVSLAWMPSHAHLWTSNWRREHDCSHWFGHESGVPCLVPKAWAGRYESKMKMRFIPRELMEMLGKQSQVHLTELNLLHFPGIITAEVWGTSWL